MGYHPCRMSLILAISRLSAVGVCAVGVCAHGLFTWSDLFCAQHVSAAEPSSGTMLYASSHRVAADSVAEPEELVGLLVAREYEPVSSEPVREGQFSSLGSSVSFITREFIAEDGLVYPPVSARFEASGRRIVNNLGPPLPFITLEPAPLRTLVIAAAGIGAGYGSTAAPAIATGSLDSLERYALTELEALGAVREPEKPVRVFSSLDPSLERCGIRAIAGQSRTEGELGVHALVAVETATGRIRAWAEDTSDEQSVITRPLPRGSVVKAFVYLDVLGADPGDALPRSPFDLVPALGSRGENDPSERRAPSGKSELILADVVAQLSPEHTAWLAEKRGPEKIKETLTRLKIDAAPDSADTSLLRLTAAFASIAAFGIHHEPRLVTARSLSIGSGIEPIPAPPETRVADPAASFLVYDMLRDAVRHPERNMVETLGDTVAVADGAAKDGSTRWFIVMSPALTVGLVSVGSAARDPSEAARAFMRCAGPSLPREMPAPPAGISRVRIDARCYGAASPLTPARATIERAFLAGTQPVEPCAGRSPSRVGDDRGGARAASDLPPSDRPRRRPKRRTTLDSIWDRIQTGAENIFR